MIQAFLLWSGLTALLLCILLRRSARDVLSDIESGEEESKNKLDLDKAFFINNPGFNTYQEWKKFRKKQLILSTVLALTASFMVFSFSGIILGALFSAAICFLAYKLYLNSFSQVNQRKKKEIERELPFFIEDVVIAAESGMDLISSLKEACSSRETSVGRLFTSLITSLEGGASIEGAIKKINESYAGTSLSFALLHLQVAYKEGGGIRRSLRELGEAIRARYQDHIEERIAKLPAKATLPLAIAFGGVLLLFLAIPLTQIVEFAKNSGGQL
jgi:pilus assembly protein TadC